LQSDTLKRYKLRLSDGTVLVVDFDGLGTWVEDREAMVQAVGSRQWRPLKQFLAHERIAARRALRRSPTAAPSGVLPLVYPTPRVAEPAPPPAPSDELVEPPAAETPAEATETEQVEGPSLGEPAELSLGESPLQVEDAPHPAALSTGDPLEPAPSSEPAVAPDIADAFPGLHRGLTPGQAAEGEEFPAMWVDDETPLVPETPASDEPVEPHALSEPAFEPRTLLERPFEPPALSEPPFEPPAPSEAPFEPAAFAEPPIAPPLRPDPLEEEAYEPQAYEPPPVSTPATSAVDEQFPAVWVDEASEPEPPSSPLESEPLSSPFSSASSSFLGMHSAELPASQSIPEDETSPLESLADEAPRSSVPASWHEAQEPHSIGAPPNLHVLADDPAAARAGYGRATSDADLPVIPLKPLDAGAAPTPRGVAGNEPLEYEEDDQFVEGGLRENLENTLRRFLAACEVIVRELLSWGGVLLGRLLSTGGSLVSRTASAGGARISEGIEALTHRDRAVPSSPDEPLLAPIPATTAPRESRKPAARPPDAGDEEPIRLKPLDDEEPAGGPSVLQRLHGWASDWFARLAGRNRPSTSTTSPDEPSPWPAVVSRDAAFEPGPSTVPPPGIGVLADEPTTPSGAYAARKSAGDEEHGWAATIADDVTGWVDRLTHRDHKPPASARSDRAAPSSLPPLQRESLKRPPSINELPVLRLAKIEEAKVEEDVYDADDSYGGAGFFRGLLNTVWVWTTRIAMVVVVLACGTIAALTWETWLPKAIQLSHAMFTEVDDFRRSREQAERQERAQQEATAQLPHLSPETIRLILSRSPDTVLDPAEVFRVAYVAEDRGLTALTADEAQQLTALRAELLEALRPTERERIVAYDRAGAYRETFPFENSSVLEVFARGARALPPASLERLQALSGKAVAAGLEMPAAAPASAAER
jgi:hypothetical protein